MIVDPRIYCSSCSRCKDGNTHGCTTLGFKGTSQSLSHPSFLSVASKSPYPATSAIFFAVSSRRASLPTFQKPHPNLNPRQYPSLNPLGLSGTGGGFSEAMAVDAKMVYPLPADIELSLAALIEPLAVAWHAITTTGFGSSGWKGRSVLVIGGGPIGIAVSIVLRSFGCEKVIVSEPIEVRRRQNEDIAALVINPVAENVGE